MKRDLNKDLKLCDKTTSGPFEVGFGSFPADALNKNLVMVATPIINEKTGKRVMFAATGLIETQQNKVDACFIAESREGWPYAINRALEAEEIIRGLMNSIGIYTKLEPETIACFDLDYEKAKQFLEG